MEDKQKTFDELMVDYLSGTLTKEGEHELLALLKSDSYYRKRFKELARTHAYASATRFEQEKWDNYKKLSATLSFGKPERKIVRRLWHNFTRVAAVALITLGISALSIYIYQRNTSDWLQDKALCHMEVPLGSQTKLTLPDGTVVRLNSGSTLQYAASFQTGKTREVYLQGEGYFEVEKNPQKPFIVHANELDVKVLGTTFNVRGYEEDTQIKVSLLEGEVNVYALDNPNKIIALKPGEQATYNKQSKGISLSHADVWQTTQWTTGRLSFVNARIPEILKEVERRYDVKFHIQSKQMEEEIFSGSISTKLSVEEILDYIDVDNKYSRSRKGNVIVLTDR